VTLIDAQTGETLGHNGTGRGMVRINEVKVGARARKDLGNIDELSASIKQLGLLQPILLDSNLHLIAGSRRLEACRRLGWSIISATVAGNLDDTLKALHAERDENICRKDFTPSELVEMGRTIEAVEGPQARQRMLAGDPVATCPQGPPAKTRDVVGAALGISGRSYSRAKAVVTAAEDPDHPAYEVAKEAQQEMDASGNINAASEKVRAAGGGKAADNERRNLTGAPRVRRLRSLAEKGYDRHTIAAELGITPSNVTRIASDHGIKIFGRRGSRAGGSYDVDVVVDNTCTDLALSLETTAGLLEGRYASLDPVKVEGWVSSLESIRKSLNRLMSNLKEKTRD